MQGPFVVGAKTLYNVTDRNLVVEVWYPSATNIQYLPSAKQYDIHEHLPAHISAKIPKTEPKQVCDCFDDIALDTAHGPYPVLYFAHG